ncbi:MAG: hypothetical protein SCK70_02770 [bacterium]|nr:hypothetical protein [bacterium]
MKLSLIAGNNRSLFFVLVLTINIILAPYAWHVEKNSQQYLVWLYLIFIQAFVIATFFKYRDNTSAQASAIIKIKGYRDQKNGLKFSDILIQEFNYARETAAQAMNDRHTMINYFIVISAAVLSFLGSRLIVSDPFDPPSGQKIQFMVGIAFLVNFIGWLYFLHLIRLRQAWVSSAQAMNQIKEFFIINSGLAEDAARSAFLWKSNTIPPAGKRSNVFYYSIMLISLISAGVIFFASWCLFQPSAMANIHLLSVGFALFHYFSQMPVIHYF